MGRLSDEDINRLLDGLAEKKRKIPEKYREDKAIFTDNEDLEDVKNSYEQELSEYAVEITHREKQIEQMLPDAKRGFNVKQGALKSGGRPKTTGRNAMYQKMAEDIWNKQPKHSKTAVARSIEKKLLKEQKGKIPSKKDSKIPKVKQISQLIKKPT